MPVAIELSAARSAGELERTRPMGKPTKIVSPAIAPRMSVWAVLMRTL